MLQLSVFELARQLRDGDPATASPYCEEMLRRFEPLFRKAWRPLAGKMEYQDFVHDSLLRLLISLPHLKDLDAFPGYLRRIVLSVAADALRREASSIAYNEYRAMIRAVDETIQSDLIVRSYLDRIPPRERDILRLDLLEGMDVKEIGKVLGLSQAAVRSMKSRGIKRLRQLLAAEQGNK